MNPAGEFPTHDGGLGADVAVVIDVLRATSVMVTALDRGAAQIMTCRTVGEARELATRLDPRPLLCGERGCKPIDGFDLGNSPAEYTSQRVRDRTLVLTTTNGTRAIDTVREVPRVLVASFLNLSAVIDALDPSQQVHLVCAGTEGQVTLEDVLLAGAIAWKCQSERGAELADDASTLALQLWRSWFADDLAKRRMPDATTLARRFRETRGGKNLLNVGYEADLSLCASLDSIGVVPERIHLAPAGFALPN